VALEARSRPLERDETGAGDAAPRLEIEDAERLSDLPVRDGRRRQRRGLAPLAHQDVLVLVPADGHRLVRDVRDREEDLIELPADAPDLLVELLDPSGHLAHPLDLGGGVGPLLLEPRDPLAIDVPLVLERFRLDEERAQVLIEREEAVEIRLLPLVEDRLPDDVRVPAYELHFQHRPIRSRGAP